MPPSLIHFTFILCYIVSPSHSNKNGPMKRVDITDLNPKTVGLVLKANGKQYFVSSELCPGGVFFTQRVNENCLCYNGIFQIVRHLNSDLGVEISTDNLEWRMDYKCGTTPAAGGLVSNKPIRAILPLSKPHSRFSSIVVTRSLTGNNTARWRKFDTEDIIIRNDAQLNLVGKTEFEIVNLKPLGREIRIMIGKSSEIAICYGGWLTETGHQNLRVSLKLADSDVTMSGDCCLKITQDNSPGEVSAECTTAKVQTEIIDVQSADMDIGNCDMETEGASRRIRKRDVSREYQTVRFKRSPDGPTHSFSRKVPSVIFPDSTDPDDLMEEMSSILVKRASTPGKKTTQSGTDSKAGDGSGPGVPSKQTVVTASPPKEEPDAPSEGSLTTTPSSATTAQPSPTFVITPRKRGISRASFREQAQAINEFIAIIRNDLSVEIREPETYRFQLLKKSFDIFLSVVPNDIIPEVLVKTAFDVFYYLYEELDSILQTPPQLFERTMEYLDACSNIEQPLNFTTYGCPAEIDNLVVDSATMKKLETFYDGQEEQLQGVIKSLNHVQIKKDRRFIPERHDIYVEINWKVVDFVHSFCFEHFSKEFNAHHFYETEIEKLFLFPEVQRRWFARAKDLRYARGIFPVSDLKMRMKQLDKVTAIGHYLSRYNGTLWLFRPSVQQSLMQEGSFKTDETATHEEKRLMFAQNMMDEATFLAAGRKKYGSNNIMGRVGSMERDLMYPFQFPEKMPVGELIWDGMAVCLHAGYSNRRSYFMDSSLWGVVPSLTALGNVYP